MLPCHLLEKDIVLSKEVLFLLFKLLRGNLEPIILKSKEAKSHNGTAFMAGIGGCSTYIASRLLNRQFSFRQCRLMPLWAVRLPSTKGFIVLDHIGGRATSPGRMKSLLEGSEIRTSHLDCDRVQDAYTLEPFRRSTARSRIR